MILDARGLFRRFGNAVAAEDVTYSRRRTLPEPPERMLERSHAEERWQPHLVLAETVRMGR